MSSSSRRRSACRLCESKRLELALPLTPTPVADHYVPKEKLGEKQPAYALDLHLCMDCGHVQLLEVVDPKILFENYIYVTTASLGLVEHFKRYAAEICERLAPPQGSLVIDVGSNIGSLLQFFKERGHRVLGVDPAKDIARRAAESGVPTLPEFLTPALADSIRAEHGAAEIVTANNVFAHADDLAGMADAVRKLLAPKGVFIFEVNHLSDIVRNMLFDTVYHEHLSYHSVLPLKRFLAGHGLDLFDIQHSSSKGGSIRCFAQLTRAGRTSTAAVAQAIDDEERLGLHKLPTWQAFAGRVAAAGDRLRGHLDALRGKGESIAGFGASATVTTFMYRYGVAPYLEYLVDDNKNRHGLFSPGAHLPVLSTSALYDQKPRHTIILAWRYAEPIMKTHRKYLEQGGTFIVPLPELAAHRLNS